VLGWTRYHAEIPSVTPSVGAVLLTVMSGVSYWALGLPKWGWLRRLKRSALLSEATRVQSVAEATVRLRYDRIALGDAAHIPARAVASETTLSLSMTVPMRSDSSAAGFSMRPAPIRPQRRGVSRSTLPGTD